MTGGNVDLGDLSRPPPPPSAASSSATGAPEADIDENGCVYRSTRA